MKMKYPEVKVSALDKEELVSHIKEICEILDKYPYFQDPKSHYVTTMSRAKTSAYELQKWINCLDVER